MWKKKQLWTTIPHPQPQIKKKLETPKLFHKSWQWDLPAADRRLLIISTCVHILRLCCRNITGLIVRGCLELYTRRHATPTHASRHLWKTPDLDSKRDWPLGKGLQNGLYKLVILILTACQEEGTGRRWAALGGEDPSHLVHWVGTWGGGDLPGPVLVGSPLAEAVRTAKEGAYGCFPSYSQPGVKARCFSGWFREAAL